MSGGPRNILNKTKDISKTVIKYFRGNPRRLKLLGVAVVVVVLGSYGMLMATNSPLFCQSCHEMKPAYGNWKTSVHAEVGCVDCHIKPGFGNLLLHKMMSYKEIVAHLTVYNKPNAPKIHARDFEPVNDACGQCHSMNRTYSFSGDLKVPHKLHLDKGLTCPTCHSRVVHGNPDQRKPKMETCLTCHDGKKAPDKCGACHTKKAVPASHKQGNWFKVHGQMTKTINCGQCHNWRPDWCMQCHKQKPKSHLVLWRSNHGANAKADRTGCNACHQETFCLRCHGVAP
ncbi:MAG TPA: NapC/NirT family cytochrome c [Candidatus Aquicultor sp.]